MTFSEMLELLKKEKWKLRGTCIRTVEQYAVHASTGRVLSTRCLCPIERAYGLARPNTGARAWYNIDRTHMHYRGSVDNIMSAADDGENGALTPTQKRMRRRLMSALRPEPR